MTNPYNFPRPAWLDAYLDYPHGGLTNEQAREVTRYALSLEQAAAELPLHVEELIAAKSAGSTLARILREISSKVNYQKADFYATFRLPASFNVPVPDGTVAQVIHARKLSLAIQDSTREYRDQYINPLIDALIKWTEGKADIRQIEKDLL